MEIYFRGSIGHSAILLFRLIKDFCDSRPLTRSAILKIAMIDSLPFNEIRYQWLAL
jgi:hypothetical protein